MNNKDIFKYGEDILNSINKATETGDFSNLSRDVKSAIGGAASSLGSVISSELMGPREKTPFFSTRVNKYSSGIVGLAKTVGGGFIVFISSLILLGSLVSFGEEAGELGWDIGFVVFSGAALLGGLAMIVSARNKSRIIKEFFEFGKIVGNRSYITIKELSDKTGNASDYVVRQIKRMKALGYLPYAVLDKEDTTLMLTDEVYKEYLKSKAYNTTSYKGTHSKKNSSADKNASSVQPDEKTPKSYFTIDENLPKDVKSILKDGNEYLNKIRYFNDLIPDTESMSDKLYTLEATALSIFKKLKESPDIAGELRKFMAYYLPTTERLLQSYVDLRKAGNSLENITKSQKEIEEATDVINSAFVNLLNQLFESTSWDISADISAMKTMMKQDALL
ncbi:MAG: 5-bromo-4-chloroindolyl phosphate hydrolysis family protein [Treponema sp.]|nr:5-bromo-4-chloroindolyl phosphate hydrolysis family protein [Treponema sp.]